jgi:hypothetical protein
MRRQAIVLYAAAATAAAFYTGARDHGRFFTSMTGFLPPHYGYSAYAAAALLFLAPRSARGARFLAAAALLLSGNRAAWVGVLAGVASRQSARDEHLGAKLLLLLALALAGVLGGLALKPHPGNDSNRVLIWKAVVHEIREHPAGNGGQPFEFGVGGQAFDHAHSDVLEVALRYGVLAAAVVCLLVLGELVHLPASPEKAALVALTVPCVIDNRLTTSGASLALYLAVWVLALRGLEADADFCGAFRARAKSPGDPEVHAIPKRDPAA